MELLLLAAATLGGVSVTLIAPLPLPSWPRMAAGFCLGTVLLGLAALVLGSLFGLGTGTVWASALIALAPALALTHPLVRARAAAAWREARAGARALGARPVAAALVLAYVLAGGAALWRVFDRSCFMNEDGLYTADAHNFGDLPFHLGVIQGFVLGGNLPPEHPELAGARLTYPFLVDLVTALMVKAGASPARAIVVHDWFLAMALAVLLVHLARRWTGDRLAALLTPLLVLLSGGLGFVLLADDARTLGTGLWDLLWHLPDDYTIRGAEGLRWGNALVTLLVTQRSFLMGLPLFALAAALWWDAVGSPGSDASAARARLAAAGVAVGALPLVHGHSFAAALAIAAALTLLFPRREWAAFFAAALALAVPQALWMATGTSMQAGRFFALDIGWDNPRGQDPITFWLWNTGVFLPILAVALTWRPPIVPAALPRFYLPFACCFVVPNLFRLSPWIWDNIKFLFLWWVASAPLVAAALARLLRGGVAARLGGAALLLAATLAGALDVWRVAQPAREYMVFSRPALDAAEAIARHTPPRALVLHAPTQDTPVLLAGRRSLLGYEGHIWSQGLDKGRRPELIASVYERPAAAREVIDASGVDYVLVGPQERHAYRLDEGYWRAQPLVVETGEYRLYRAR